jgi:transposase
VAQACLVEHGVHKVYASDKKLQHPDRYGQNGRVIALNRKNTLFAGSDGGGEHWAVIASLIETCKLCSIEPHNYLADVIIRIVNGHPNSKINDLLPWAYTAALDTREVA